MTRYIDTRARVADLFERGLSGRQIAARLGLSPSTGAYHLRNLDKPPDIRCNRRYDWREIQRYYDEGHSITECQEFGFARETWNSARRRGAVVSRPQAMAIEKLLTGPRRRTHLTRRLMTPSGSAAGSSPPATGVDAPSIGTAQLASARDSRR